MHINWMTKRTNKPFTIFLFVAKKKGWVSAWHIFNYCCYVVLKYIFYTLTHFTDIDIILDSSKSIIWGLSVHGIKWAKEESRLNQIKVRREILSFTLLESRQWECATFWYAIRFCFIHATFIWFNPDVLKIRGKCLKFVLIISIFEPS